MLYLACIVGHVVPLQYILKLVQHGWREYWVGANVVPKNVW
jgi:hypothetical protein